jgi:hypothetical protein
MMTIIPDPASTRERDAELVREFAGRHFSWRGSCRLHRASFGLDLLRAPVNVVLAPIFLVVRLTAILLSALRLKRAGRWLATRRILLRSDASRAVEHAVIHDLLPARARHHPAIPQVQARLVEDYVGTRSAIAEIVTTLLVLGIGLLTFRAATPGVLSLAPLVSDRAAFDMAVAMFPLGEGLGWAWYSVFPHDLPGWFIATVALGLVMSASLVSTFAGVVADPIQAALGIHQRRLMRLLARLDATEDQTPAVEPEHLLARLADISDATMAVFRALRS